MPILYVLRHGETDFNVAHRLQGHYETSLNAHGRQQAVGSAALLRLLFERDHRRGDDFAYVSSPLKRARETMEIVRETLGLDPHIYAVDDRLMEISYGDWEGLTLAQIQARDAEVLARREHDKWDFAPGGGESYRELAKRVADWYATVSGDTVVTAHGGVVRVLMANFHVMAEDDATHADILHGAVYVFAHGTMTRYT